MNVKEAYQRKLEAQLDLWKAELDVLRAKIKKEDVKLRIQLEKEIDALKEKMGTVNGKLSEIKEVSSDAWDDLRYGAEMALIEMEKALKEAASRFKDR